MPRRANYPRLPDALHRLLADHGGVWTGTPTELYEALEAYRAGAWPSGPVGLSLWLQNHGKMHGLEVEARHTGKARLLRLTRPSNGLEREAAERDVAKLSWDDIAQALAGAPPSAPMTLIVEPREGVRIIIPHEARFLLEALPRWRALYPKPHRLELTEGAPRRA